MINAVIEEYAWRYADQNGHTKRFISKALREGVNSKNSIILSCAGIPEHLFRDIEKLTTTEIVARLTAYCQEQINLPF